MPSVTATINGGRIVWILAAIVGLIVLVIGLATGPNVTMIVIGALFLAIGGGLTIVSLVTKGVAD